jgi:hypothetical protein
MSLLDSIGSSGGPSGLNNKLSIISKIVGFINNSNKSPRELAIGMMNNMDKNTSVQLKISYIMLV